MQDDEDIKLQNVLSRPVLRIGVASATPNFKTAEKCGILVIDFGSYQTRGHDAQPMRVMTCRQSESGINMSLIMVTNVGHMQPLLLEVGYLMDDVRTRCSAVQCLNRPLLLALYDCRPELTHPEVYDVQKLPMTRHRKCTDGKALCD